MLSPARVMTRFAVRLALRLSACIIASFRSSPLQESPAALKYALSMLGLMRPDTSHGRC